MAQQINRVETSRLWCGGSYSRIFLVILLGCLPACFKPTMVSPNRAVHLWNSRSLGSFHASREGNTPSLTLEVEQAVQLALQHNLHLQGERSQIEVASAQAHEEGQLKNPEIRLNNMEIDKLVDHEPVADLGLRVPIPQPWIRDARVRRAELRVEEAKSKNRDLTHRIRGKIYKLYATLAMLDQETVWLERTIELSSKSNKLTKQSVQDGTATHLDASLTLMRQAELVDERHELHLRREAIICELRQLVGIRPDQEIAFRPNQQSLALHEIELDEKSLIQDALRHRHDLREASAKVTVAQVDTYISRTQRWPWFRFVEFSYNFKPNLKPLNFELALALEVPLLSWNRGAIAAQDARLAQRRIEEQSLVLSAAQEVHDAITRVRETTARVREIQKTLLPTLEAGAKAVDEAVSHGVVDPRRAIAIQWRSARANRRYLKALLEHQEAFIDLEVAVGEMISSSTDHSAKDVTKDEN